MKSENILNQLQEVFNKLYNKLQKNEREIAILLEEGKNLKNDLENLYATLKVFLEENKETLKKQEEKQRKELENKIEAFELLLNNFLNTFDEEIKKIQDTSREEIEKLFEEIEKTKKAIEKLKNVVKEIGIIGIAPPTNVKADYISAGEFGKRSVGGEYVFPSGSSLTIAGNLKITSGNPGAGKVLTSDAYGNATWQTPSGGGGGIGGSISIGQVAFGTASNTIGGDNNFYWDNTNKRLGIGTTVPNAVLHTKSGTYVGAFEGTSNVISLQLLFPEVLNYMADLRFTVGSAPIHSSLYNVAGFRALITQADPNPLKGALLFFTNRGDLYQEAMRITDAGNVGIGTTAPSQRLTVAGNIGIQAGADAFIGTLDNHALSLRTNNTDIIFITNNGNVGIRTTTPQYALHVVGELAVSGYTIFNGVMYQWPSDAGTSGQVLTTDGYGQLRWTTPSIEVVENLRRGMIGIVIGDGVNEITPGFKGAVLIPFNADMVKWTVMSIDDNPPTLGDIVIDVLISNESYYPEFVSAVGSGEKPFLTSDSLNGLSQSDIPNNWEISTLSMGDIIGFNVVSASNLKKVILIIEVFKHLYG